MNSNIEKLAFNWATSGDTSGCQKSEFYCATRDVFISRLDKMTAQLLNSGVVKEGDAYIISAISGEIGNNSYDHNLGNWPNIPGIFFGHEIKENEISIAIGDRGTGLLNTLKRVKPELKDDKGALQTAFFERISGRAPEPRGNGLKFVRENAQNIHLSIDFYSGEGKISINDDVEIFKNHERIDGCMAIINFLK
jgi:hypothetical protein